MTSVARSDHDSGDYSDASHQEIEQDISGNDGGQPESDYESQGSESDRSDRDPENQEAERRVDDDEDRSNPQYIPKKGTFYEHDDRTAASGEESTNTTSETTSDKKEGSETPGERRRPPRKSESINKWSHDKYNEIEQVPKSRDELVAIYGYDIRNEDAPPHARRNRRYGRGPNKYTRTWEDEEAYRRQAQAQQLNRKPPTAEDFPELDASHRMSKKRVPRPRSKSQPSSNDSIDSGSALRRNASVKTSQGRPSPRPANRIVKSAPRRDVKEIMPPIENLTISATVFNNNQGPPQRKVNATVAQQRPVPTEQKKKPPPQSQPLPQNNNVAPNKSPPQQQTASPLQQRQPNKQQLQHNQQSQQQQATSGVESRGGSKRYSSLRQRPLDTYSPQQQNQPPQQQQPSQQQQGQQHRYHGDYPNNAPPAHQGSPVPQLHPQQLMQQMHRGAPVPQATHGPSPPHQPLPQQQLPQQQLPQQQLPQQQLAQQQLPQPQISQQQLPQQQISQQQLPQQHAQQVRLGMMEQPPMVPHGHHPIHTMPPQPHNMGQLQPAQGYAPPAMMPAQYMQQQSGSGAVFTGAPIYAQPPAPYPHQMYTPHHNYAPAPGMTYYTCPEPEQPPRAQRRSAAIPIVRPAAPPASDRPANSSEKDNIDRIVENMFVRKPWPAQGVDPSKEKPSDQRVSQEPPSKESSQPNSLTSSSISTDSKPSESREEKEETKEEQKPEAPKLEEPDSPPESIPDA